MGKNLLICMVIFAFFSCKEKKVAISNEDDSIILFSNENWPPKTAYNNTVSEALLDWLEFTALESSFDAVFSAGNTEELSLVLDDLIVKYKELEEVDYPFPFNVPQIRSRQKVFHTYILKTKGDLIYRTDPQTSIVQMIEARNEVITQMNAITSDTLDLRSLLE